MTKEEAIKALDNGEKISHSLFKPDEWVLKTSNENYQFEDLIVCPISVFWKNRLDACWDEGWRIFNGCS